MRYCPRCQSTQESLRGDECENCGSPLLVTATPAAPEHLPTGEHPPADTKSDLRYPTVHFLSTSCRVLAFLSLIAGLIVAGLGILQPGGGLALAFFSAIYGLGTFILLMAIAEGMKIIVDIEANTRASMEYQRGRIIGDSGEGSKWK